MQRDAEQVAAELDEKADRLLLGGKADRAYCENLLSRFSREIAAQFASMSSDVERSKVANRYELQNALQAAMGQILEQQTADAAAIGRVSTASSHASSGHNSRLSSRPGSRPGSASRGSSMGSSRPGSAVGGAGVSKVVVEPPHVGPLTVRLHGDGRTSNGAQHARGGKQGVLRAAPQVQLPASLFGEHSAVPSPFGEGGGGSRKGGGEGGGGSRNSGGAPAAVILHGPAYSAEQQVLRTINESLVAATTAAPLAQLSASRDAFQPGVARTTAGPSPGELDLLLQRPGSATSSSSVVVGGGSSRNAAMKTSVSASGLLAHAC